MADDVREFGPRVKDCILDAIVGEQLGMGQFRTVYALDDKRVLKVEHRSRSFCNHDEWTIWKEVEGTKWEKWFAPVLHADAFGCALIMARTRPLTDDEWATVKKVPSFFCDLKKENWGWYEDRPVCHDYGNHLLYTHGLRTARMKARRDV